MLWNLMNLTEEAKTNAEGKGWIRITPSSWWILLFSPSFKKKYSIFNYLQQFFYQPVHNISTLISVAAPGLHTPGLYMTFDFGTLYNNWILHCPLIPHNPGPHTTRLTLSLDSTRSLDYMISGLHLLSITNVHKQLSQKFTSNISL